MKAIFLKDVELRFQGKNVAFSIKASPEPQLFPKYVIDAAVEKGAAEIVKPKRQNKKAKPEGDEPTKSGD